jgi:hypothetical protein
LRGLVTAQILMLLAGMEIITRIGREYFLKSLTKVSLFPTKQVVPLVPRCRAGRGTREGDGGGGALRQGWPLEKGSMGNKHSYPCDLHKTGPLP